MNPTNPEEFDTIDNIIEEHPEQAQVLRQIKSSSDIQSLTLTDSFTDDHELCVGVIINNIKFGAWWIVPEFYADLVYAEKGYDPAKQEVANYIQEYFED